MRRSVREPALIIDRGSLRPSYATLEHVEPSARVAATTPFPDPVPGVEDHQTTRPHFRASTQIL
jgi:hypothetical protein